MSEKISSTAAEEIVIPDFDVIVRRVQISRPAEDTWGAIGQFADAGKFLNVSSRLLSGDGHVGSVRLIGDKIIEVMVGRGTRSYTYVQTEGPMAARTYHGCLSLEPSGTVQSTLVYTVSYDTAGMDKDLRAAEFERITARFQGMVEAMKDTAEAVAIDALLPSKG